MYLISEVENNLIGMGHGATLRKVRNKYQMYERAANNLNSNIKILEVMREQPLSSTVYDNLFKYAAPSDFDTLIGLYPQAERKISDDIARVGAEAFDRRKSIDLNKISIEGSEGSKILKINYPIRQPKLLHNMNSYDGNGTWAAVNTALNIVTDTVIKYSGSGSVRFDQAANGDGIKNTTMNAVDLSEEDEIADLFLEFYIKNSTELAKLTSVTLRWGNDLTANYWTGVAQTLQADGTAFKVGWNTIKVPWSTATETGTVAPATIDSVQVTFTTTAAITDICVDNILVSIGSPFSIKYYGKYLFKNSSGTWIVRPTSDADYVVCDSDSINIFLFECMRAAAQQMEGEDSAFDITFAEKELFGNPGSVDPAARIGLYGKYRAEHPRQTKKMTSNYGFMPKFRRIR